MSMLVSFTKAHHFFVELCVQSQQGIQGLQDIMEKKKTTAVGINDLLAQCLAWS